MRILNFYFCSFAMLATACGGRANDPCATQSDCRSGLVCSDSLCLDAAAIDARKLEASVLQWRAGEQARLQTQSDRLARERDEAIKLHEASDEILKKAYAASRDDAIVRLEENRIAQERLMQDPPIGPAEQAARLQAAYAEVGEDTVVCRSGLAKGRTYIGCRYDDSNPPTLLWTVEGRDLYTINGKAEQLLSAEPTMRAKKPLRPRAWLHIGRKPSAPDVDIQAGEAATRRS